jgi:hypothetical protein
VVARENRPPRRIGAETRRQFGKEIELVRELRVGGRIGEVAPAGT